MHRDWSCVSYFSSDLCRFRSSVTALKSAFTIRCCGCTGLLQAFALRFSRSLVLSPSILFPRVTIFTLVQLLSGLPFCFLSFQTILHVHEKGIHTRVHMERIFLRIQDTTSEAGASDTREDRSFCSLPCSFKKPWISCFATKKKIEGVGAHVQNLAV